MGGAEKFESEILPDAELNPLLNPLLAAHMGRWAEVYFTSPPEKRAQAVSDLIHELKSAPPKEAASVHPITEARRAREITSLEKPLPTEELQRTCSACSAENPADQKFCGMCGVPLQSASQREESKLHAAPPAPEANWREPLSSGENDSVDYSDERASDYELDARSEHDNSEQYVSERPWRLPESELPHFAVESESVPYSYRLYIGIAVAILLGGLLYMAWHSTPGSLSDTSESRASRVIPSAPPASPAPAPQEPAATRNVLPTDRPAAAPHAAPAAAPPASRDQPETASEPRPRQDRAPRVPAPSSRVEPAAANSATVAPGQSGAEELANAQRYLNGGSAGTARDNRQAAEWLWKAVGKGNLSATLVLSDLYLRGDGIPKSCDQARLLLDAAAKKGKSAAADRLRNLRAFGCQ